MDEMTQNSVSTISADKGELNKSIQGVNTSGIPTSILSSKFIPPFKVIIDDKKRKGVDWEFLATPKNKQKQKRRIKFGEVT